MEFAAVGALLFVEYLLFALLVIALLGLAWYVLVRAHYKAKKDALKSMETKESK